MQNKRAVTVRSLDIKCLTFPTILKDTRLTLPPTELSIDKFSSYAPVQVTLSSRARRVRVAS